MFCQKIDFHDGDCDDDDDDDDDDNILVMLTVDKKAEDLIMRLQLRCRFEGTLTAPG